MAEICKVRAETAGALCLGESFVDMLRVAQYSLITSRCRLANKPCEFFVCEMHQYLDIICVTMRFS